jgi:hypothetical protein
MGHDGLVNSTRQMPEEQISIRKINAPFYWIPKQLLDSIRPTWQGLLAYNALMYYAVDGRSRNVGIPQLAQKAGTTEYIIRRGLKDLIAKNAIRMKERVKIKNGKRMTMPNEYTLIDLSPRKQAI